MKETDTTSKKLFSSFAEAVADIPDGSTVLIGGFGPGLGSPGNLLLALRDQGARNLTIVANGIGMGGISYGRLGSRRIEPDVLITNNQVKRVISSYPASPSPRVVSPVMQKAAAGELEVELCSQGTLSERIRAGGAGIGGFYTPTGVGTVLETGKEKRAINGIEMLLEYGLVADYALIKAHKADNLGNLVFRGTARSFNPMMAMAARCTIVEVREIVPAGAIDPEHVVTPHIFVHRVVAIPPGGML